MAARRWSRRSSRANRRIGAAQAAAHRGPCGRGGQRGPDFRAAGGAARVTGVTHVSPGPTLWNYGVKSQQGDRLRFLGVRVRPRRMDTLRAPVAAERGR